MVRRQGSVRFDGRPIENLATEDIARLGIAHVPDGRGTFFDFTTEENLRIGAYTRKDRHAVMRDFERVYNYFPRLKERRHQQAGTLSGGEQQMLAIARALMLETGEVVMSGSADSIRSNETVRRAYLGY
jgi:branched-chain amino acid transport system ATP-binding protein